MRLKQVLILLSIFPLCIYSQEFVSSSSGKIKEIFFTGHHTCRCAMLDLLTAFDKNHEDTVTLYYEYQDSNSWILEKNSCNDLLITRYKENNHSINKGNTNLIEKYLRYKAKDNFTSEKSYTKFTQQQINKLSSWIEEEIDKELVNLTKLRTKKVRTTEPGYIWWVQDAMLVRLDNDSVKLLYYLDTSESNVELLKAMNTYLKIPESTCLLEKGGNIQFLDSLVFIGKGRVAQLKSDSSCIADIFKNKKVIYIGTENPITDNEGIVSYQPSFHLDLFMNSIQLDSNELLFIFSSFFDEQLNNFQQSWNNNIKEISDNLKKDLDTNKFSVTFEFIPIYSPNDTILYSYSNAIYEIEGGYRKAYLPSYEGVPQGLESLVSSQLKKYDIDGCFIDQEHTIFSDLAKKRGSLHCISKVLQRATD